MRRTNTFKLILCAFFAALSAVLSQVFIPIGLVPVNFIHVSIFVAAGLLGAKYGTLSQVVFVLLGAFGVPVFTGFTSGMGIIMGPTGGFIFGYIGCVFVSGLLISRFGTSMKALIPSMYVGMFVSYAFGIPWLMHVTGLNFTAAVISCLPFIPGDLVKIIVSAIIVNRLHPTVKKMML